MNEVHRAREKVGTGCEVALDLKEGGRSGSEAADDGSGSPGEVPIVEEEAGVVTVLKGPFKPSFVTVLKGPFKPSFEWAICTARLSNVEPPLSACSSSADNTISLIPSFCWPSGKRL